MKYMFFTTLVFGFSLSNYPLFGDTPLKPDIRGTLRITGTPILHQNQYLVPISASIRNTGTDIAGQFKVNAEYAGAYWVVAPFARIASTSEFMSDGYYAWNRTSIPVGQSKTLNVYVIVPKTFSGSTVQFRVNLDSCVGEEMMPFFCRINELDERNNFTNTVSIAIP